MVVCSQNFFAIKVSVLNSNMDINTNDGLRLLPDKQTDITFLSIGALKQQSAGRHAAPYYSDSKIFAVE
jgi:hypothetical protein